MLFRQNTWETGNNAVDMSQAFQKIAQFEHFTDLNLFKLKYSFNVIQNWETNALQILFDATYFLLAVVVEEDESSQLLKDD